MKKNKFSLKALIYAIIGITIGITIPAAIACTIGIWIGKPLDPISIMLLLAGAAYGLAIQFAYDEYKNTIEEENNDN